MDCKDKIFAYSYQKNTFIVKIFFLMYGYSRIFCNFAPRLE